MEYLTISKHSVIAPLISNDGLTVKSDSTVKMQKVRKELKSKEVEVHFLEGEKVRFLSGRTRTIKVTKKCLTSVDTLCDWILERANKELEY